MSTLDKELQEAQDELVQAESTRISNVMGSTSMGEDTNNRSNGDQKSTKSVKKRKRSEGDMEEGSKAKKPGKKDHRSRHWFCTANNYNDETIKILLSTGANCYAFQEEKGDEGTPHLQGVFSFKNARFWSSMDKKTNGKVYWAPCRNVQAARNYCTKKETRSGKRWEKGYKLGAFTVTDPLEGKKLYQWQQEVVDLADGMPDERSINWYWSDKGYTGKSAIVKHLCLKHGGTFVGGKFADAFYAINEKVKKKEHPHLVIFDLPRSMGNKITYIGMESIKNGCIFNSKYESTQCLFNPPHIMIFANEAPNIFCISKDRWIIKNLDNEKDVKGKEHYNFSTSVGQY